MLCRFRERRVPAGGVAQEGDRSSVRRHRLGPRAAGAQRKSDKKTKTVCLAFSILSSQFCLLRVTCALRLGHSVFSSSLAFTPRGPVACLHFSNLFSLKLQIMAY